MITAAGVVLAFSLLFGVLGPRLGRRLRPGLATRLLTVGSVVVAASTGSVLAVAAFTLIGQVPQVAAAGRWSAAAVRDADPVPPVLAVVCGLGVALAAGRAVLVLAGRIRAFIRIYRAGREAVGSGAVVVVDSDRPEAFATPGIHGRIVVTTGLMRLLSGPERCAVLAHERSHVAHRHVWWLLAADLAAAAHPLLAPTARAVAHAVERWADEDAAAELGDRRLVARALARVALLRHRATVSVPAATGGDVPRRVQALLEPQSERFLRYLAVLGALLLVVTAGSALVQERGRELFAQASISQHHR